MFRILKKGLCRDSNIVLCFLLFRNLNQIKSLAPPSLTQAAIQTVDVNYNVDLSAVLERARNFERTMSLWEDLK
jgi:hypothetical protein